MRTRFGRNAIAVSALLVLFLLAATPSFCQSVLYTNGPINGTGNAWNISNGYTVADSFTLASTSTIGSFSAGLWALPVDTPTSVQWEIVSGVPFVNQSVVASGTGSFSNTSLGAAKYGYNLYASTVGVTGVTLGAGNYYLELYNAVLPSGDSIYWDENDGLSTAYQNGSALPGSEAFTIYSTSAATPEPGTMLMFGTGVLGLLGAARRRFSR
jgi:hypothetical protein